MNMHDPAHPGEILSGWLHDLDLTVTAAAQHLGVSRVMFSRILHGHAGITADMDVRLSQALGTSPGYWLRLQSQHDLWQAQQRAKQRPALQRLAA